MTVEEKKFTTVITSTQDRRGKQHDDDDEDDDDLDDYDTDDYDDHDDDDDDDTEGVESSDISTSASTSTPAESLMHSDTVGNRYVCVNGWRQLMFCALDVPPHMSVFVVVVVVFRIW